jgi:hypothetical protein
VTSEPASDQILVEMCGKQLSCMVTTLADGKFFEGFVDSIDRDAPGVPSWKIIASDLSSNTAEVEYWVRFADSPEYSPLLLWSQPQADESVERIGVGSSYRFVGRIAKTGHGQPKLVAIAIKECAGEEEILMSALQKAAEAKKSEV